MAEVIVALFDERGELISSNDAHATMIGRPNASMIGKSWRDWTPKPLLEQAEVAFARCVAGEPMAILRQVLRSDDTIALCRCQGFVTRRDSGLFVVSTMQLISIEPDIVPREAFGVADYINDMAVELSQMSARAGLKQLGRALDTIVRSAGEVADLMKDDAASRH